MGLDLLVVDDSLTVRKLVEIAFKGSEARLTFAVSGTEGLARAAAGDPPHAILLDYVLPDMRGAEVCRRLAEDPRLARVPVVLMSAKNLDLREQFAAFPAVVDFVAKPFTRGEIVELVERASSRTVGDRTPAPAAEALPAPAPELFSRDQKEGAARLLFRHLKAQLGQIPAWCQQLGDANAAAFFARKLLTPEAMERMLAELAPLVLEAATAPPDGASCLAGQLSGGALIDLFRTLEGGRRSGTMGLGPPASRLVVHWRGGAVALATCLDPAEYLREAELPLEGHDAGARGRAEDEQRRTGKPIYATLAEAGLLAAPEAQRAIAQQGRRLLRRVLREPSCRVEWREGEPPALCGALEQPIPVAQVWLERLRAVASLAEVERRVPSFQTVFERAEHFSAKVRQLDLAAGERRLLALVDGRATVQDLIDRGGVAAKEAAHTLFRMVEIGLLRPCANLSPRLKLLIVEPDADGFRRPLAAMLERRTRPVDLVPLDQAGDLAAAALRERPALVLLNATAVGTAQAESVARAVAAKPDCAGAVVALVEPDDPAGPELAASPHFDAVLTKPVHLSEIERLLPS